MPETVGDRIDGRILVEAEEETTGDPPDAPVRESLQDVLDVADKVALKPGTVPSLQANLVIVDDNQTVRHRFR
jgi:hypothetical protein